MWPALPAPEYYGGSAPPWSPQQTTCLSRRGTGRPAKPGIAARTVPVFTSRSLTEGGTRLYPRGIATATPQSFTVASLQG
jgi:hypothetical protein